MIYILWQGVNKSTVFISSYSHIKSCILTSSGAITQFVHQRPLMSNERKFSIVKVNKRHNLFVFLLSQGGLMVYLCLYCDFIIGLMILAYKYTDILYINRDTAKYLWNFIEKSVCCIFSTFPLMFLYLPSFKFNSWP